MVKWASLSLLLVGLYEYEFTRRDLPLLFVAQRFVYLYIGPSFILAGVDTALPVVIAHAYAGSGQVDEYGALADEQLAQCQRTLMAANRAFRNPVEKPPCGASVP